MVAAPTERGPIAASGTDQSLLAEIARLVDVHAEHHPRLLGPNGEQVELPEPLLRVLREATDALAQDRAVTIGSIPKLLTTQQAADLIGVSRPYLVRLLEEGEIPYSMTGSHRRIPLPDLMAYAERQTAKQREGLARLTQMSQEMGLYPSE